MDNKLKDASKTLRTLMGAGARCPMCQHNQFQIVDGYISQSIQPSLEGFQIGGPSIPCVVIVCTNCGFVSQHALGVIEENANAKEK